MLGADTFAIPDSVCDAIDAGAPPLQAFREWRGLSVEALAAAAGIAAEQIASDEVAAALKVPVALLLE